LSPIVTVAVFLIDGHHCFTYLDDRSEEAIAVELESRESALRVIISGRILGDRGECARCRNGDMLIRRCEGDFGSLI
jgi:hypothetical protein